MKKLISILGLMFAFSAGLFAIDEASAKNAVNSFLTDPNARAMVLDINDGGQTGRIWLKTEYIMGMAINDGDLIFLFSEALKENNALLDFEDIEYIDLDDIKTFNYNSTNKTLYAAIQL